MDAKVPFVTPPSPPSCSAWPGPVFVPGTKVLLVSRSHRQSKELFGIVTEFYRRFDKPMLERLSSEELRLTNFSRIVSPMLAVSNGRLVCLSTPFGRRGFFYEAWGGCGGDDWSRIELDVHKALSRTRMDWAKVHLPKSDTKRQTKGTSEFRAGGRLKETREMGFFASTSLGRM